MRNPKAKAGELIVGWGKQDGDEDLFYCYPGNIHEMKRDMRLLMLAFETIDLFDGKNLRESLAERGYDIRTLKFSIRKKSEKSNPI